MTDDSKPTPLPTVNPGASLADKTVQDIIKATEEPVKAAIIAAQPFMATPVLLQIWEAALDYVYRVISTVTGRLTGYIFIDIQQYFALKKAAEALAELHAAQLSGDAHAIAEANAKTDAAVTPILHYIGSVQPKQLQQSPHSGGSP